MSKITTSEITEIISIDQLKPGMYVKSFSDNNHLSIKSEGYISCLESITQLRNADIVQLVIVPDKEKQTVNVEKVFADIKTRQLIELKNNSLEKLAISFDSEMKKASDLYKNAKLLQEKILSQIRQKNRLILPRLKNQLTLWLTLFFEIKMP